MSKKSWHNIFGNLYINWVNTSMTHSISMVNLRPLRCISMYSYIITAFVYILMCPVIALKLHNLYQGYIMVISIKDAAHEFIAQSPPFWLNSFLFSYGKGTHTSSFQTENWKRCFCDTAKREEADTRPIPDM